MYERMCVGRRGVCVGGRGVSERSVCGGEGSVGEECVWGGGRGVSTCHSAHQNEQGDTKRPDVCS